MVEPKSRAGLGPVLALWLGLCGLGSLVLLKFQATPGGPAVPPSYWPSASALKPAAGRATLLLFAHPRCSCTKASVDSLAWIVSRAGGRLNAYAVFYAPSSFPAGWERTDLWRDARSIPGAAPVKDEDGREARLFGALTSGQALLFDASGRLVYQGGITGGRGHFGDNQGRDAVLALASGRPAPSGEGPVFGCALMSAVAEREAPEGHEDHRG